MAKNETSKVPRFTIPKPKTGQPIVAKIAVPRVTWDSLPNVLEQLIGQVDANKTIKAQFVKGVLSIY